MAGIIAHNAYVMKHGDRVAIFTFMDASEFPGIDELGTHAFVECTTQKNVYSNFMPYITVLPHTMVNADEWGEKTDGMKCTGLGLAGIVTRMLFYMKRFKDPFGGLLGEDSPTLPPK